MPAIDRSRAREDVMLLPDPAGASSQLNPRAWVESVRRPITRQLDRPVAEHLADARDDGEA